MEYRYVNIEFGIDLGGKYSYHCFIKVVISKVLSLYGLITPYSAEALCVFILFGFAE